MLRVRFYSNLVAIIFNEFPDFPFETRQLFASPGDLAVRVVKCLGHGGNSSNLEPLYRWAIERLQTAGSNQPRFERPSRQWRQHLF
jgi:hypothetical protein